MMKHKNWGLLIVYSCNIECSYSIVLVVDGAWSEWGDFGDCSVKCGHGTKTRTRTCNNPEPANGGDDCYGDDTDSMYCYVYKCPGKLAVRASLS